MSGFDLSSMLLNTFGAKKSTKAVATYIEEGDGDDLLRAMLPTGFGKCSKKSSVMEFDKTKRGEEADTLTTAPTKKQKLEELETSSNNTKRTEEEAPDTSDDDDDDDSDANDAEDEPDVLPTTHEIRLTEHYKTVSAVALDPAGSRLITGSYDYTVKLWDFAGMDSGLRSFRSIEPFSGHQIHDIQYSPSGDQFLIASGSARAKLFDRDGDELVEFAKGDPYIHDPRHTDGHIAALTSCAWHPTDRSTFITASNDSTIRVWDIENKRKQKEVIVMKSKGRGGKTSVTATGYSPDGKWIAGAGQDGSFSLWATKGPHVRPSHSILKAHTASTDTTSICFSNLNSSLVTTRGGDDSLKLWDIRNFKTAVAVNSSLPSLFPEMNAMYSPDERFIITGTAAKKGEGWGQVALCDATTLETLGKVNVVKASVVRVLWHSRLNQIVAGCADSSTVVLYNPNVSVRGAKLCALREKKQRSAGSFEAVGTVITPHSLPMFREDKPKSHHRKMEKIRKDPIASRRPDLPLSGAGRGGRVGSSANEALMKSLTKNTMRDEDPREALLKYAKDAETNPYWVMPAYQQSQPKPVFDSRARAEDQYEMKRRGDLKTTESKEQDKK